ncbi:solute carrier family 22 member 15-like [Clytia hemisphaerica]|uniref:solute carrier family 22 member 15-like n=1 Tax=Clytia hemisphaerica TaxID=252671 RepID=UPI0034D7B0E0
MATSVIFLGTFFGAIFLGWYSDQYGRKRLLYVGFVGVIVSNFLTVYMPNIWLFIALRFVSGFLVAAVHLCYYVMITETVGDRYRSSAGNILWLYYTVALCILPLKAYLLTSWKLLVIICSLPYLIMIVSYGFVPESVRWLRLKSKFNNAMETFQRIADWNEKNVEFSSLAILPVTESKERTNIGDLFHPKETALTSVVFVFCFYTNSLVYFGTSLASSDLGTDSIYLNFLLVSLVEFPALSLATFCCDRFGRKWSSSVLLALAGFVILLVSITPKTSNAFTVFRIILSMTGKLFVSISFPSIFNWVVEVYPTNIRSEALGIMGIAVNIGGASAPWVAKGLTQVTKQLPLYVMGTMGLVAGILCRSLPETKEISMKESRSETKENTQEFETIKNLNFLS